LNAEYSGRRERQPVVPPSTEGDRGPRSPLPADRPTFSGRAAVKALACEAERPSEISGRDEREGAKPQHLFLTRRLAEGLFRCLKFFSIATHKFRCLDRLACLRVFATAGVMAIMLDRRLRADKRRSDPAAGV